MAAVVGVMFAAASLGGEVENVSSRSHSALLLSKSEGTLSDMLGILLPYTSTLLAGDALRALDAESQRLIREELLRTDSTPPEPTLPRLAVPLSVKDGVALQQAITSLVVTAGPSLAGSDDPEIRRLRIEFEAAIRSLQVFIDQPTVGNFRVLRSNLALLRTEARGFFPMLVSDTESSMQRLNDRVHSGRLVVIAGILIIGGNALLVTMLMGNRLQRALRVAQSEQETLGYRNNQLNALYAVFSEITDSLSLRYVVEATVRESQRLVSAHAVILRLVRQEELVVIGSLNDIGESITGLTTVELGEGPVGRVARRGKTLRLLDNAFADGEGEWGEGAQMRSGLIVPLIVGARVVGTVACWSRDDNAFSDDDQRVMEMMASQVATAVAAADSTENFQRRARLDPLTGLSNRRELDQDLRDDLAELAESGRKAVVAMIDIDHFKRFNDDYGHQVGDVTLQKVAAVMKSSVRESDRVYRYGGEEFVAVLVDADREQGVMLAERMRAAVETTPLTGASLEPVGPVTISVGLALFPDQSSDFRMLIQLADEAMYSSKQGGRNRVTVWSPPVLEKAA